MDRRSFMALGAAGFATLGLSRAVRAADTPAARRKFLFIHNYGGWDTTHVFQSNFGVDGVDMEEDATEAVAGGVTFVDSEKRPFVRSFFEKYGPRSCIINGIEVPSITHERCSRIMMTGSAEGSGDDWGATLAGRSEDRQLLPYLVVSGTAFTGSYASRVVRVGSNGQLADLLSGDAILQTDKPVHPPATADRDRLDAWLATRAAELEASSPIAARFAAAHADQVALQEIDAIELGGAPAGCVRIGVDAATALDAFEAGLSRTALVQYTGWCNQGWDTHSNNALQSQNFDELFDYLARIMVDLDSRTAPGGGPLSDEVCIVVLSEMGRTPKLHGGGRNHWTFTSAMLVGAGVRGGQVVSGFDGGGFGASADFETGEVVEGGAVVHARNVGATLLALGDVDPGEIPPISAVIL